MIYYSHRTRKALAEGHTYLPLGFAHYSYGSVCQKFLKLFKEGGLKSQEVIMPEIYANAAHLAAPEGGGRPMHVAFKPYEEFRMLKGAANVAHVAWEFDKVPNFSELPYDHPRRDNVLNDYVHVMGMAAEIWVGCEYTKAIFERHGLARVQVMPAPIETRPRDEDDAPVAGMYKIGCLEFTRKAVMELVDSTGTPKLDNSTMFRADDCRAAGGRVFFSVFNPGDPRKNVAALFLGFQEYLRRTGRHDLLIVKLVLDGSPQSLRNALAKQLPKHFEYAGVPVSFIDCSNILLVPAHLSTEELGGLYRAADFYVCTSAAEGQGLPVQEAMAAGLVPISSAETAMGDYIKPDHAIVMQARSAAIPLQVANAYGLWGVSWRLVDHHEVVRALQAAVALPAEEFLRRSRAARAFIHDNYGFDAVRTKLLARIKELAA
jgi:glycosyltransferase involved in cell wall biosynthesis